jgi:hypothetical protein
MGSRDDEPQEDDVAGHVRDEHMARCQVAACIYEVADKCHRYKERCNGPTRAVRSSLPPSTIGCRSPL